MQSAIEQFRVNVAHIGDIGSIANVLATQTTSALDISDILRAELVMVVSVLDHYVHELVRLGMLDAYRNNRVRTPAFLQFQVSLAGTMSAIANPSDEVWIEQEIRARHGHRTFQTPENIAMALSLISEAKLWDAVADHIQMSSQDVRDTLKTIVDRRNQIAHEADMDPSYPDTRWLINAQMVDEAVNFVDRIAEAIYVTVRN